MNGTQHNHNCTQHNHELHATQPYLHATQPWMARKTTIITRNTTMNCTQNINLALPLNTVLLVDSDCYKMCKKYQLWDTPSYFHNSAFANRNITKQVRIFQSFKLVLHFATLSLQQRAKPHFALVSPLNLYSNTFHRGSIYCMWCF